MTDKDQMTGGGGARTDAPADPALAALKRQKEMALARQEIAKAAAETRKALAGEGKGREGKVELGEGGGYFAELLGHRALAEAASEVAARVKADDGADKTIVLTQDWAIAERVQLFHLVSSRIDAFISEVDRLTSPSPTAPTPQQAQKTVRIQGLTTVAGVAGLLGAGAQIASFFRSDLKIAGRTVSVPDEALLATVADGLRDDGWKVIVPDLTERQASSLVEAVRVLQEKRSDLAKYRDTTQGSVQADLDKLARKRQERELEAGLFEKLTAHVKEADARKLLEETRQRLLALDKEIAQLESTERGWEQASAQIDALLEALDTFISGVQTDGEGSPSLLTLLRFVDSLGVGPDQTPRHALAVKLSSQGGEVHIRNGTLYTKLGFVGGVSIAFVHMDGSGEIRRAGNVPALVSRYVRLDDIEALDI